METHKLSKPEQDAEAILSAFHAIVHTTPQPHPTDIPKAAQNMFFVGEAQDISLKIMNFCGWEYPRENTRRVRGQNLLLERGLAYREGKARSTRARWFVSKQGGFLSTEESRLIKDSPPVSEEETSDLYEKDLDHLQALREVANKKAYAFLSGPVGFVAVAPASVVKSKVNKDRSKC